MSRNGTRTSALTDSGLVDTAKAPKPSSVTGSSQGSDFGLNGPPTIDRVAAAADEPARRSGRRGTALLAHRLHLRRGSGRDRHLPGLARGRLARRRPRHLLRAATAAQARLRRALRRPRRRLTHMGTPPPPSAGRPRLGRRIHHRERTIQRDPDARRATRRHPPVLDRGNRCCRSRPGAACGSRDDRRPRLASQDP